MREVVDEVQAVAHGAAVHAFDEFEVDVVDGLAVFKAVDQIQRCAADALDGGQAQLHGAGGDFDGLGAQVECALVRLVGVFHTKGHAAGRRAVLGAKVRGLAVGLAVQDEVDAVLAVQHHVLGPVLGNQREAQLFKHRLQHAGGGRGEFNELEPHQSHGVVPGIQLGGGLLRQGSVHGVSPAFVDQCHAL
ncbi:hypothetical protein D3C72_1565860 [compost metagenome]